MAPAQDVLLHEEADLARVERLSIRLRDDGVLRNPPIVTSVPDGGYVVLDGANRTSALLALGARVIPVQVVTYAGIRLEVWSHFLLDGGGVPHRLRSRGIALRARAAEEDVVPDRDARICYVAAGDDVYEIDVASHTASLLAAVVGTYKDTIRIYRVPGTGPGQGLRAEARRLAREYGAPGTLVIFPMLAKDDILAIARGVEKLPTGITRHVIAGRALRLDVPLHVLTSPGSVGEKDAWLSDYVRGKLLDNRVRYYPEATFLFDE